MTKWKWTALLFFIDAAAFGAAGIQPPSAIVGDGLETIANVTLEQPAPPEGLEITLTSSDPQRLLFSKTAEAPGLPVLKIGVRAGYRGSADYFIQVTGNAGSVAYTATAPGYEAGSATVTLAPSGIVFARATMGMQSLVTTTGATLTDLVVYSGVLDAEMNFLHPQPVAGGRSLIAAFASSNPKVGVIAPASIPMAAGSASAAIQFRPVAPGETTLSATSAGRSSAAPPSSRMPITVLAPGIALTDDLAIGRDLAAGASVSLGEHAPTGGIVVRITSDDPAKLLLSKTLAEPGSPYIDVAIPAGGVTAHYYLQGIADRGVVTYTATAPGFRARTASVTLTPSGLVIGGPQGPPDEAELLNREIAEGPHGFVTGVGQSPTVVSVYSVQLDPKTLRGADLTVQPVRHGKKIKAVLTNSNPAAGKLNEVELTVPAGSSSAVTQFVPGAAGKTDISLSPPAGFARASNSTSLTVIVKH